MICRTLAALSIMTLTGCQPQPVPESTPPTPAPADLGVSSADLGSIPDVPKAAAPDAAASVGLDAVEEGHYVFLGTPVGEWAIDCAAWDSPEAKHRRPPQQFDDATDYPTRHSVRFRVRESVQTPPGVTYSAPSRSRIAADGEDFAVVAFALSGRTFPGQGAGEVYDKAFCERLNTLLSAEFVVLHAYPIHVDRGNSVHDPWDETFGSLGSDPGKQSRGFTDREAARGYAKSLVAPAP